MWNLTINVRQISLLTLFLTVVLGQIPVSAQDSISTEEVNGIKTLTHYSDGKISRVQSYDANGAKWQEIEYHETGGSMSLFGSEGKEILKCDINEEGLENGTCIRWHNNGLIAEKTEFREGKKNGMSRQWYENGQLEEEISYLNDSMCDTCKWTRYFENGAVSQRIDPLNKLYEYYYQNGIKKYELLKDSSKSKEYYLSGALYEERIWQNNMQGAYIRFFENGRKSEVGYFEKEKELTIKNAWDARGKQIIRKGKGKRQEVVMTPFGPADVVSYYRKGKIIKMKYIN